MVGCVPAHAPIKLLHVSKSFGAVRAVVDVSLELPAATLVVIEGPNGSGKSTLLGMVGTLIRPTSGRIDYGALGTGIAAVRSRIGWLGHDTLCYPDLTGRENIELAARLAGADVAAAWTRSAQRFAIGDFASRPMRTASRGQRQRVALARALAREPGLLLLDEPLSSLDAHTRATVRAELQELLREFGLPTILVTHDFDDAAALADEVGVIVQGRLRQLAPPQELVARPADAFVASFTGANLLHGTATRGADELTVVRLESGEQVYSTDAAEGPVGVVVYPWEVTLGRHQHVDSALNTIVGDVRSVVHVGTRVRVQVGPLTAEVTAASAERLEVAHGGIVVASFKATGTKLVPLG
jgi:ABC-type sugar transport system ATPase subunit